MREAFVDTSFVLAIALRERGWEQLAATASGFETLRASDLLIAEFLAALKRERQDPALAERPFRTISCVFPDRSLRPEIDRVLAHGALRGADLWHLACALYVSPDPAGVAFLTRDGEQRRVAKRIGFPVP